jgi:hypothetical protein
MAIKFYFLAILILIMELLTLELPCFTCAKISAFRGAKKDEANISRVSIYFNYQKMPTFLVF